MAGLLGTRNEDIASPSCGYTEAIASIEAFEMTCLLPFSLVLRSALSILLQQYRFDGSWNSFVVKVNVHWILCKEKL